MGRVSELPRPSGSAVRPPTHPAAFVGHPPSLICAWLAGGVVHGVVVCTLMWISWFWLRLRLLCACRFPRLGFTVI
eukprot:5560982-Prymnesium_polylepis.1